MTAAHPARSSGERQFSCLPLAVYMLRKNFGASGAVFILWSSITVQAGVDFLGSWHGIPTGDMRIAAEKYQSLLIQFPDQIFCNFWKCPFPVNEMFCGIFQQHT